jgi:hypothetical protein
MRTPPSDRLRIHRNPLRMFFSTGPWAATAYLVSYIPVGTALFVFTLVILVISYALNITWLGLPLLVGAAGIVRGCAEVERKRTLLVSPPITTAYRPVVNPGIFAQLKTRWTDPSTLRNCAYLVLLFPVLVVFDAAVACVFLTCLTMITIPLWYWAIPQTWPNGETGRGLMIGNRPDGLNGTGGVWIGDLPMASLASVVGFALALLTAYLVVAGAMLHLKIARSLLGEPVDPLAPALRMLAEPGPLTR